MYFGASKETIDFAKELRANETLAEVEMWKHLRESLVGVKFRRQHPIDRFIVDFYCVKLKLAIEIDGAIHDSHEAKDRDENRTGHMADNFGLIIIRFSNDEVLNNVDQVLEQIAKTIAQLTRVESRDDKI